MTYNDFENIVRGALTCNDVKVDETMISLGDKYICFYVSNQSKILHIRTKHGAMEMKLSEREYSQYKILFIDIVERMEALTEKDIFEFLDPEDSSIKSIDELDDND